MVTFSSFCSLSLFMLRIMAFRLAAIDVLLGLGFFGRSFFGCCTGGSLYLICSDRPTTDCSSRPYSLSRCLLYLCIMLSVSFRRISRDHACACFLLAFPSFPCVHAIARRPNSLGFPKIEYFILYIPFALLGYLHLLRLWPSARAGRPLYATYSSGAVTCFGCCSFWICCLVYFGVHFCAGFSACCVYCSRCDGLAHVCFVHCFYDF